MNAITDVAGVEVGYTTLIEGSGKRVIGRGPVRTGVTALLPRGRGRAASSVFAGYFSLNGNGELTGCHWVEEAGRCDGPICITNTHSCGTVRDATIKWLVKEGGGADQWWLPVVGETFDGYLNDINGFHVRDEHVFAALDGARGGAIEEGSVGGGTGMICYGFKGGSGTASRVVEFAGRPYVVGALVQSNFGRRDQLTIAGVPVGAALAGLATGSAQRRSGFGDRDRRHRCAAGRASAQTIGAARRPRDRSRRVDGRTRLGRHLPRVFDRQRRCAATTPNALRTSSSSPTHG